MSRRNAAPDSLELLLDTLCNTFGGVLFIALLVVLLLQLTGERQAAMSGPARPDEDAAERRALAAEIKALRRIAAAQAESLDPATAREAEADARLIEALRAELDQGRARAERIRSQARMIDEQAKGLAADAAERRRRIDELREREQALVRQIAGERARRTRTLQTPLLHDTSRQPIACELRYGRFYVLHRYDASGGRVGLNDDDYFVLDEREDEMLVSARPTAGLPIDAGVVLDQMLRGHLRRFPSGRWHLDLIVRSDSFDAYHTFRAAAQAAGYEMSLLLVGLDDEVQDRGGKSRGVQ